MKLKWDESAWEEYTEIQARDKQMLKRINAAVMPRMVAIALSLPTEELSKKKRSFCSSFFCGQNTIPHKNVYSPPRFL